MELCGSEEEAVIHTHTHLLLDGFGLFMGFVEDKKHIEYVQTCPLLEEQLQHHGQFLIYLVCTSLGDKLQ